MMKLFSSFVRQAHSLRDWLFFLSSSVYQLHPSRVSTPFRGSQVEESRHLDGIDQWRAGDRKSEEEVQGTTSDCTTLNETAQKLRGDAPPLLLFPRQNSGLSMKHQLSRRRHRSSHQRHGSPRPPHPGFPPSDLSTDSSCRTCAMARAVCILVRCEPQYPTGR